MAATAYTATATRQRFGAAFPALVRETTALILNSLLFFTAAFLLVRRCAGGLNEPLSAAGLICVAVVAVLIAEAVRLLSRQADRVPGKLSISLARNWLPSISLPLLAVAISLSGSSAIGVVMLWLVVIGEEAWLLRTRLIKRSRNARHHPHQITDVPNRLIDEAIQPPNESAAPDWNDQAIAQRIIYRRTAEGFASVEGWVRAAFAVGQRTAIVHVAFCPPFANAPRVESEPLDGPDCEVRSTLVLPWGVRWEVKLATAAAEPAAIVLEFFAVEQVPPPKADQS